MVKPYGLQSTSHETHRIGKYKQCPLGTDDESLACTNLFNPTLDCRSNVDIQADDPCEDSWGTVAHPIIPRPACYQPLPTQMSTYSELEGALDISRCNPCSFSLIWPEWTLFNQQEASKLYIHIRPHLVPNMKIIHNSVYLRLARYMARRPCELMYGL